jgi:hypothetical protein
MLGDYDVGEFKVKWDKMVIDFGLQDNKWLKEMYEQWHIWATTHIRSKKNLLDFEQLLDAKVYMHNMAGMLTTKLICWSFCTNF